MRVLVLAPQPFFVGRGTPIAVRQLVRTLVRLGHTVDLVTFHLGDDADLAGARLHRTWAIPGIRSVGPGFSLKKVVCDLAMGLKLVTLLSRRRYDLIHAVEESAFLAGTLGRAFGVPFVFDMDSAMPEQLADRFGLPRPVRRALEGVEAAAIRGSIGVVAMCQALVDRVEEVDGEKPVALLEDISLLDDAPGDSGEITPLREALPVDGALILYVGNLEPYQGIDLLVESFARVAEREPTSGLVIIGGDPADIRRYRARVDQLGIGDRVALLGPRPVGDLGAYLAQADILASPRVHGSNTPMKIYSYMDSGVPILATRLPTHEQALNDRIAQLADPDPDSFARGMLALIEEPDRRDELAAAARRRVAERHSPEAYRRVLGAFYEKLDRTELDRTKPATEAPLSDEAS